MKDNTLNRFFVFTFVCSIFFPFVQLTNPSVQAANIDDLKKLDIICFVPSYLPDGFHLKEVDISYDDYEGLEDTNRVGYASYFIEYGNDQQGEFTIESARWGIGDRNIMVDETNAEETEIQSPLFGPVYLIYSPKGKTGIKTEIIANWCSDANLEKEKAKNPTALPILGRVHGFSAKGIDLEEYEKIIQSLSNINQHAISSLSEFKVHPKVFNMVSCWLSDSEEPVVTEINLDAVEVNQNQFNPDELKQENEWIRCSGEDRGFMRYRLLESKDHRYKVEYQENGGGTLTTSSIIEFSVEKREIQKNGNPISIRILRVLSYNRPAL